MTPRIQWNEPHGRADAGATGDSAATSDSATSHPETPLLDGLGRDLTALARQDKLPALFGREAELRQLVRILLRKQKNNPLVIGLPGVGKTALVEGLANLVAHGGVPPALAGLRIVELSPAMLMAGTHYRGSFEARLQQVIREAAQDPHLLLFVDEIHTLVRAGAVEGGALDAANLLKPALARGEVRCIGATTPGEFERFLRSDAAFERRFELLRLDEPPPAQAVAILSAARPAYEAHHHVEIQPAALEAAVHLSMRHVLERSLPDKAFDLLDDACTLARLPAGDAPPGGVVTAELVAQALAEKQGIPLEKLQGDERDRLADLPAFLRERVFGQELALQQVAAAVQRAAAGLHNPERPRLVCAFFGSSGVGKTAAAESLAEFLFGSAEALIRLDLSEFNEPHTISRLWGAPPGYVGYGDEGTFASRLRRQPYSVVLLDEFEKAHPQVLDGFLQTFDHGRFQDGRGRPVDARQAYFILTSNLFTLGEIDAQETYQAHAEAVRRQLSGLLRPEFVNRIDEIVLFASLGQPARLAVARREIERLNARLARYGVQVEVAADALAWIAAQAEDANSGARAVMRLVERAIAAPAAKLVSAGEGRAVLRVRLDGDSLSLS